MNSFPIIIRPEYLEICEGDHCAAAILDLFKRWSSSKLKKKADTWIYKSQPELRDDLMGLFGLNKVAAALLKLRDWGYIQHRQHPRNRQDKTLQYQIDNDQIAESLALLSGFSDVKTEGSEPRNEGSEALKLKSQAPDLSDEESMNQSLIPSGMSSEESSSSPTHHPDDDDLAFFKTYEKRFGSIQPHREQLRTHTELMSTRAIIEVLERCAASQGRSWSYVLTAMSNANKKADTAYSYSEGSDNAKWKDDPSPLPPSPVDEKEPSVPGQRDISENDTESDDETTDPPDLPPIEPEAQQAWNTVYGQLEIQLDRASFDTWLRGAWLYQAEGNTFTVAVSNSYARDMLQHRMYRDIGRIMTEVCGQPVELVFEVKKARAIPREEIPLFKLLAQYQAVMP